MIRLNLCQCVQLLAATICRWASEPQVELSELKAAELSKAAELKAAELFKLWWQRGEHVVVHCKALQLLQLVDVDWQPLDLIVARSQGGPHLDRTSAHEKAQLPRSRT